jgi:membrane protein insertase Oxa1/YidC/SpoIIIJ
MASPIDPNKYSKYKEIKADSFLSNILAITRLGLMLLGIVGQSMEVFREHGWLQILFSKLFQSTTSMLLIPLILFALWFVNRWLTSPHKSETAKYGDSPMYIMMAAGSYYLFKLITSGSF